MTNELLKKITEPKEIRIKRLAFDKANLSIILSYTDLYFKGIEVENEETKLFIEKAEQKIKELKIELLTELENL
jgi:hypothetical protein